MCMATVAKLVYPHITKDPEVCGGRACVEGTRIRVMDIVAMTEEGKTADQIVEELPSLESRMDVYAALLYWNDHKSEIETDFAEDLKLSEESERERLEIVKKRSVR